MSKNSIFYKGWICGFVDGEGCFHCSVVNVPEMRLKKRPIPEFVVVQHKRSMHVLEALRSWFQCGLIKHNHGDRYCFCVRDIGDLSEVIVPFFLENLLLIKHEEVLVFHNIVQLMREKKHLTVSGLIYIEKLSQKLKDLKKVV